MWSTVDNVETIKFLLPCLIIIPYDNLCYHFIPEQRGRLTQIMISGFMGGHVALPSNSSCRARSGLHVA